MRERGESAAIHTPAAVKWYNMRHAKEELDDYDAYRGYRDGGDGSRSTLLRTATLSRNGGMDIPQRAGKVRVLAASADE